MIYSGDTYADDRIGGEMAGGRAWTIAPGDVIVRRSRRSPALRSGKCLARPHWPERRCSRFNVGRLSGGAGLGSEAAGARVVLVDRRAVRLSSRLTRDRLRDFDRPTVRGRKRRLRDEVAKRINQEIDVIIPRDFTSER